MIKGGFLKNTFLCLAIVLSFTFPKTAGSETISEIQQKAFDLSEQRAALENEITAFEAQLLFLENEIARTDTEIIQTEEDLKKIELELAIQSGYLSENIRAIYEEGQKSFLEVLFSARTLSDFMDRNEYLEVTRAKLKESSDRVRELKKQNRETQKNLEFLKEIQAVLKSSLEKQRADKLANLTVVLEEEKRIREKFSSRLLNSAKNPYCKGAGKIIRAKNPVFMFPVECGYISQGYGNTEFAVIDRAYNGKIHNGFDVGVATGTRILSIGSGTVYATGSSPSGGWGNWIMVKQDKVKIEDKEVEFYALYAHLVAETHLKVGDKVKAGDIIGFVGGTPYWAPHLHFSLLLSNSGWEPGITGAYPGNSTDPLNYMDIPISVGGTDWDLEYLHM